VSLQISHKLQHFPLTIGESKHLFDFCDEIIVASGLIYSISNGIEKAESPAHQGHGTGLRYHDVIYA